MQNLAYPRVSLGADHHLPRTPRYRRKISLDTRCEFYICGLLLVARRMTHRIAEARKLLLLRRMTDASTDASTPSSPPMFRQVFLLSRLLDAASLAFKLTANTASPLL